MAVKFIQGKKRAWLSVRSNKTVYFDRLTTQEASKIS
jgi:hypothetical protein